jgi:hypothetical protein
MRDTALGLPSPGPFLLLDDHVFHPLGTLLLCTGTNLLCGNILYVVWRTNDPASGTDTCTTCADTRCADTTTSSGTKARQVIVSQGRRASESVFIVCSEYKGEDSDDWQTSRRFQNLGN